MKQTLAILSAILLALPACRTSAQVGHDEVSLEWLVASSDSVVRATVARVTREPAAGQWVWLSVTLAVRETLKGKAFRLITVAQHPLAWDRIYDEWRDLKREQLWFLQRNEKFGEQA